MPTTRRSSLGNELCLWILPSALCSSGSVCKSMVQILAGSQCLFFCHILQYQSCACVRIVEQPLHQTTVSVRLYSRLAYSRFAYFRPKSGRSRLNGRRQTGNIPILHGPYNVFMCNPASHAVMNLSSVNLLKSTLSSGDVRRSRVCPSSVW